MYYFLGVDIHLFQFPNPPPPHLLLRIRIRLQFYLIFLTPSPALPPTPCVDVLNGLHPNRRTDPRIEKNL